MLGPTGQLVLSANIKNTMSWCFVTQTVFSLDLDGTCIETLHEMATFVLETPHQNTECQLQGCHESSLTNFTSPF